MSFFCILKLLKVGWLRRPAEPATESDKFPEWEFGADSAAENLKTRPVTKISRSCIDGATALRAVTKLQ
jgi:hypothetical protein